MPLKTASVLGGHCTFLTQVCLGFWEISRSILVIKYLPNFLGGIFNVQLLRFVSVQKTELINSIEAVMHIMSGLDTK